MKEEGVVSTPGLNKTVGHQSFADQKYHTERIVTQTKIKGIRVCFRDIGLHSLGWHLIMLFARSKLHVHVLALV